MTAELPTADARAAQEREALIALATQVDEARLAANAIDSVSAQAHAYGDLSDSLKKILGVLTGSASAARATYLSILDGNTVTEALDWVSKNHS